MKWNDKITQIKYKQWRHKRFGKLLHAGDYSKEMQSKFQSKLKTTPKRYILSFHLTAHLYQQYHKELFILLLLDNLSVSVPPLMWTMKDAI